MQVTIGRCGIRELLTPLWTNQLLNSGSLSNNQTQLNHHLSNCKLIKRSLTLLIDKNVIDRNQLKTICPERTKTNLYNCNRFRQMITQRNSNTRLIKECWHQRIPWSTKCLDLTSKHPKHTKFTYWTLRSESQSKHLCRLQNNVKCKYTPVRHPTATRAS